MTWHGPDANDCAGLVTAEEKSLHAGTCTKGI